MPSRANTSMDILVFFHSAGFTESVSTPRLDQPSHYFYLWWLWFCELFLGSSFYLSCVSGEICRHWILTFDPSYLKIMSFRNEPRPDGTAWENILREMDHGSASHEGKVPNLPLDLRESPTSWPTWLSEDKPQLPCIDKISLTQTHSEMQCSNICVSAHKWLSTPTDSI